MWLKITEKLNKINIEKKNITVREFLQSKSYDYVSIRMLTDDGDDYFIGTASCKKGKLIPLDSDSYGEEAIVKCYEKWTNIEKEIYHGITIWCDDNI